MIAAPVHQAFLGSETTIRTIVLQPVILARGVSMSTTGHGSERPENGGDFGGDFEAWEDVIEQAVDRGDLNEFFEAIEDIQSMDPGQRFTKSADRLHTVFSEEAGGEVGDLFDDYDSSPISREMYEAFDNVWDLLQQAVLKDLRRSRDNEDARLLLALYLEKAQEAFVEFDRSIEHDENIKRPLSIFIALSSRLIEIVFSDDGTADEEMLRDVAQADYYLSDSPSMLTQYPEEISDEEIRKMVRLEGAVLAYDQIDISVSRGAELADVPQSRFKEALERYGITPKYGPDSIDDLVKESSVFSPERDE